jgi:HicB family
MQLSRFVEALQGDLAAVAELGDEQTAEAARRIAVSIQGSLSMRFLDALGEAALELNGQMSDGRVEVRLVGQDPELVYIHEEEPASPPVGGDEAFTARITLRLPDGLKRSVETAADREGVSVNTWLVRALSRAVHGPSRRASGNRLTGFAKS